jgi:hypothetical protein
VYDDHALVLVGARHGGGALRGGPRAVGHL